MKKEKTSKGLDIKRKFSILVPFFLVPEFRKFVRDSENSLQIETEEECAIVYYKMKISVKGHKEKVDSFEEGLKNYYTYNGIK